MERFSKDFLEGRGLREVEVSDLADFDDKSTVCVIMKISVITEASVKRCNFPCKIVLQLWRRKSTASCSRHVTQSNLCQSQFATCNSFKTSLQF